MTKSNTPPEQPASPAQNEPSKLISEILKRTNQLIQSGDFDRAQGELLNANKTAKEQFKKSPVIPAATNKVVVPQAPAGHLPLAPLDAIMSVASAQKQSSIPPQNAEVKKPAPKSEKPQVQKPDPANDRSIEFNCYREALAKSWYDGALSNEEQRHLQELRTVLEISDSEHKEMEKEIKYSCYKNAFVKQFGRGPVTTVDSDNLTKLQKEFGVSVEEHLLILGPSLQTKQQKQRDKILVIDDDDEFLNMISGSMKDEGFDVIAVQTSDDAYKLLHEMTPDLIICDINLKTSTMNGFVLYEKVQAHKNLQNIPFIFLTGLMDEKLAWTGKELGADDYLLKPVSRNTLLSTLHGKLKRFRQLRNSSSPQNSAFC
ncbi:MAG: response regulator [Bacteroidetes bacterium]|nr:response regulator [Bacteroidota bacterium]